MARSYLKALDVQLDLIRMWKGQWGPMLGETWVKVMNGSPTGVEGEEEGRQGLKYDFQSGGVFAEKEVQSLNKADTYWVTPKMVDVVDRQRHIMPGYELRSNDIPSRNGFAYLGRPIYIRDVHGRLCNVRAFSWAVETMIIASTDEKGKRIKPARLTAEEVEEAFALDVHVIPEDEQQPDPLTIVEDGRVFKLATPVIKRPDGTFLAKIVRFYVYSDKWDKDDESWGHDVEVHGEKVMHEMRAMINCELSLFHVDVWMLNQMLPDPDEYGTSDPFMRVVAAFWTMCNQKVTVVGGMRLDKPRRKRAQDMSPVPNDIKVVALRREYDRPKHEGDPDHEPESMHYSHSFWVEGHLRNQWYPSEGRHKPKWIEPYIKGQGQLVEKDVIFDVRR